MATIRIACWNIYFSWNLVKRVGNGFRLAQKTRGEAVAEIIRSLNADVLGIEECMPESALKFFLAEHGLDYAVKMNGNDVRYNLGLLYRPDRLRVRKVSFDASDWRAKIGDDKQKRTYKFARRPLMVHITHKDTDKTFIVTVVHTKSKFVKKGLSDEVEYKTSLDNRKRIVAAGDQLQDIMWTKHDKGASGFDRFLIMGDFNDHIHFDDYEKIILRSGIESFLGTVLDPERILYSAIDLSDGKGQPTSPFGGGVQLDHIIYTQSMVRGSGGARIVKDSGEVRDDLVDINSDGKNRDSDHAPVAVRIRV